MIRVFVTVGMLDSRKSMYIISVVCMIRDGQGPSRGEDYGCVYSPV